MAAWWIRDVPTVNLNQAAERLGVTRRQVYHLIEEGELEIVRHPELKIGQRVVVASLEKCRAPYERKEMGCRA